MVLPWFPVGAPLERAGFLPAPGTPAAENRDEEHRECQEQSQKPWQARSLDSCCWEWEGAGSWRQEQQPSTAGSSWKLPLLPVSHPQLQEEMISELCGFN